MYSCLTVLGALLVTFVLLVRHRQAGELFPYQGETNSDFGDESQVVSMPDSSAAWAKEMAIYEEPKVNISESTSESGGSSQEALQAELIELTTNFLNKAEWRDSGFQTIAFLIETYYWSMREGNLDRWMECMSPRELTGWQLLVEGRTDVIAAKHIESLEEVLDYRIESAVKFGNEEYLVIVKHTVAKRAPVIERFAVMRMGTEWKITGEDGFLKYGHHPGNVSKFDILSNSQIGKEGPLKK
jgi:hypothetical protein